MRGTHADWLERRLSLGIIPAYAGNTKPALRTPCGIWDHPRVCGEHLLNATLAERAPGSSPRMRGTLKFLQSYYGSTGIIPAYAGNTLRDYSNFVVSKFMSFVFHLV